VRLIGAVGRGTVMRPGPEAGVVAVRDPARTRTPAGVVLTSIT
jgi:hypothetical protein